MKKNYALVEKDLNVIFAEREVYNEIVYFLNMNFPEWVDRGGQFKLSLICFLIKENDFLFSNSNLNYAIKLRVLYKDIEETYGVLS